MYLGYGTVNSQIALPYLCLQPLFVLRKRQMHLVEHLLQAVQVVRQLALQAAWASIAFLEALTDSAAGHVHKCLGLCNERASLALDVLSLAKIIHCQLANLIFTNVV